MSRQQLLTDWIRLKHKGQLIKRTEEPYFNHLLFVADTAADKTPLGYEVGLCHDLLEEAGIDAGGLSETLEHFGYNPEETRLIVNEVIELTDHFTKKAYPDLKKPDRKAKEAARLATISAGAQTVKYADLIYNIGWVMRYDTADAERYLRKKALLLESMSAGNTGLWQRVYDLTRESLANLTAGEKSGA